jgi:hypothetical protein
MHGASLVVVVGGGVLTVDHHDCGLPGEGHLVAFVWDFIEFNAPGEGPQDHEILHPITVPELVLDGLHMVWAGLIKELLDVVCIRPCLVLASTCSSRDAPHAKVAYFLIVATIIVGRGYNPLRTLLAPLLAALGVLDVDVRWRLLAVAWGHLPTAWGRAKFSHLITGGRLGGDAAQLLSGVPKVLLCLPGHGFHVRRSGYAPTSHWLACRRAEGEKSVGGGSAILAAEGSVTWPCQPALS